MLSLACMSHMAIIISIMPIVFMTIINVMIAVTSMIMVIWFAGRASSFEGGPRTMKVTPAFFDQWFVKPEWFAKDRSEDWRFNIHETHQDVVTSMPPDVTLIASSDFTYCEGMSYKDHVLGLQGHPEFTAEFQTALIEYRLQQGTLTKEQAEESMTVVKENPVSRTDYVKAHKMLKYFVKGH